MKNWIEFACQDEESQIIANMKIQLLWPDGHQLEINTKYHHKSFFSGG